MSCDSELHYLLFKDCDSERAFYRLTGRVIAERVCRLISKQTESPPVWSVAASTMDPDDILLADDSVDAIKTDLLLDKGRTLAVDLYHKAEKWDRNLRQADVERENAAGWYYIVERYFEEGYQEDNPIYKVRGKRRAEELRDAVATKFPKPPPDQFGAFIVGDVQSWEIVPESDAPSPVAWDELIDSLRMSCESGDAGAVTSAAFDAVRRWDTAFPAPSPELAVEAAAVTVPQAAQEVVHLVSKIRVALATPRDYRGFRTTASDEEKRRSQAEHDSWWTEFNALVDKARAYGEVLLAGAGRGVGTAIREWMGETPARTENPYDDDLLAAVIDEAIAIARWKGTSPDSDGLAETRCSEDVCEDGGASPNNFAPHWDDDRGILFFGGAEILRFQRKRAPNQERILQAFQELGWPSRIESPFNRISHTPPQKILNDTLRNLAKRLHNSPIRFRAGGDGRTVIWERGA